MKRIALLTLVLSALFSSRLAAYDITGAKPLSKLEEMQGKAKADKKLLTIVFKGSDNTCPHCAAAAVNGVKSVHNSSYMVVITQQEARDTAILGKLPKAVQDALNDARDGAYVSFTVFDAGLTKVIASGNRFSLENDVKKIREFADKVRDARKEIKQP